MENFTFKDLKEVVNKLTDEQLLKQVFVHREDEVLRVSELAISEEDIYYNINDTEDAGPLEELKQLHGEEFDINEYKLSNPKGTPFLSEDF